VKKYIISGAIWSFSGKLMGGVLGLVSYGLLSRMLPKEDLGAYFILLSIMMALALISLLGLHIAVVKLVPVEKIRKKAQVYLTIRFVFFCVLTCSAIVGLAVFFLLETSVAKTLFSSKVIEEQRILIICWFILYAQQMLISEVFRAFKQIKSATVFGGVLTSFFNVGVLLVIFLVAKELALQEALLMIIVSTLLVNIFGYMRLGRLVSVGKTEGGHISKYDILHLAWPLYLSSLTLYILTQADLWIIGSLGSIGDAAIYGAVAKMVVLLGVALTIVNTVVMPLISEYFSLGRMKDIERMLRATASLASIPSVVFFVAICLFSSDLLTLVYGEGYSEGSLVLMILSFGQLVNVLSGSCAVVLMMTGLQVALLRITILSGVVSFCGGVFLIDTYGIEGVAFAFALGMIVQNISMLLMVKFKLDIWTGIDFRLLNYKAIQVYLMRMRGQ